MPSVACALIPRLSLTSALGDRREPLGRPLALAPEPGGPQVVGEASGPAEALGIRAGMRLAEALSRAPDLVLVAPDPVRAAATWEESLQRLESLGAAVEPGRPGEAFFATEPLRGVCGAPEAVLARARRVLGPGTRLGAGPTRLAAHVAAMRMRARRPAVVLSGKTAERLVAALPVSVLNGRLVHGSHRAYGSHEVRATHDTPGREAEEVACLDSMQRLGVGTLGELARLPVAAVADRFGDPGVRALRLARGAERPLRPRSPHCELVERLGLSEAASGPQLERALRLLVERLLANPGRAGRTFRRLRIEARLAAGGGWRTEVAMRNASADAERLLLALAPRLASLPGPATGLGLRAVELGPPAADQRPLADSPADRRRGQLAEAVRQVRSAAGRDSVLRVVEVDPDSRVPERRAILSPFSEPGDD